MLTTFLTFFLIIYLVSGFFGQLAPIISLSAFTVQWVWLLLGWVWIFRASNCPFNAPYMYNGVYWLVVAYRYFLVCPLCLPAYLSCLYSCSPMLLYFVSLSLSSQLSVVSPFHLRHFGTFAFTMLSGELAAIADLRQIVVTRVGSLRRGT